MPARKKRAAAEWCEQNGVKVGDTVEVSKWNGWVPVRVTAVGESAVLLREKRYSEFAHHEPTKLRNPE